MTSWKKALALALGLPSTIIGIFFVFQELVKAKVVSQGVAQGILIAAVVTILIKMILISWKKKVTKNFYLFSLLTLIPAIYLGGGNLIDTLALVAVLVVLIVNHTFLVNMVNELTNSMAGGESNSGQGVKRVFTLMAFKVLLLGTTVGIIYFYKKDLISKVLMIMIFQLIIQVVSIKTNHQKS